jgi:hypothetical protein
VDETGYETCDGSVDESPPDDAQGGGQSPDGAGVGLWYTSDAPLGPDPLEVVVLGAPGLLPGAVTASLQVGDEAPVSTPVRAGGFVGTVIARLDDTVVVTPDEGEPLSLVLSVDLAGLPAAEDDAGGGVGGTEGGAPRAVDGTVDVGDGALTFVAAPYLAWIEGRPTVADVERGEDATLPADPGDVLCVARLTSGRAGLRTCVDL